MVLKGLALGAAVATVAIAIFAALTFQPAPAQVTTTQAANVVVLPNGMAAPQLQPAQQGAPALVEADASLLTAVVPVMENAVSTALATKAGLSVPEQTNAVQYQAVTSCAGK